LDKLIIFKKEFVKQKYSLKLIFNLENIIMDNLDWRINPPTCIELSDNIFQYIFNDPSEYENIKETFKNYASYAVESNNIVLNIIDFDLLLTHGQYIITLASISLTMKSFEKTESLIKLKKLITDVQYEDYV
jgi:hypothetical protein